jgi:hypothetical protein
MCHNFTHRARVCVMGVLFVCIRQSNLMQRARSNCVLILTHVCRSEVPVYSKIKTNIQIHLKHLTYMQETYLDSRFISGVTDIPQKN